MTASKAASPHVLALTPWAKLFGFVLAPYAPHHPHRRAGLPSNGLLVIDDAAFQSPVPEVARHIVHTCHLAGLASPCTVERACLLHAGGQ